MAPRRGDHRGRPSRRSRPSEPPVGTAVATEPSDPHLRVVVVVVGWGSEGRVGSEGSGGSEGWSLRHM